MDDSAKSVPIARTGAAMTVIGDKMLVWGGFTQEIEGEKDDPDRFPLNIPLPEEGEEEEEGDEDYPIEEYDITENCWRRHKTTGKDGNKTNVPAFGSGSVMLSMGGLVYLFGGWNNQQFSNDVFRLDTTSMVWEKLKPRANSYQPVSKCHCGMVQHEGRLIIFGGIGAAGQARRGGGAQYITCHDTKVTYDYCWNNELHSFDPNTGRWQEIDCSNRPPPTGAFTFTEIDPDHTLLFGGRVEHTRMNHVFILDMRSMAWSGPHLPANEGVTPWPTSRTLHTMVSLVDPKLPQAREKQKVIVIWGKGRDNKHVRDMWILDVASMTWKELIVKTRARMFHMTSSYYRSHDYCSTDVIIFGGNIQRKSKFDKHVVTETRVLKFGAVQSLQGLCRDVCVAALDCANLADTAAGRYLSPSLLQEVKERYESVQADPPCCHHDEVFITSKQFMDKPDNLIRNEGQHYSYT